MTLNLTELESVIPEIQHAIRGGVFAGIESPDQWTCVISITPPGGGEARKLLFSRRPRLTRLNLVPVGREIRASTGHKSIEAFRFVDAVSRALGGAIAGPMRTRFADRVVSFDMEPGADSSGFGDNSRMTLLFECTGMHANLFLLDERQIIRAIFARSTSKKRRLEVGCRYEQPGEAEGSQPVGRRVDVMRFVQSGVSLGGQISEMYDALDEIDDRKRELTGLGEALSMIIEGRRKVAESVRRDIREPIRPGRPEDLHERLGERLARIEDEIRELSTLLHGVKAGDVDVVVRARELVAEHRAREEELEKKRAMRDAGRPRFDDSRRRRDDSAPRPPRREGGFERREGSYEKREGGYQKREGGYQKREGGYQKREGGYPRRDDSAPRPPRREGGFERREGSYEKREGGYQKREGGYQRRDDSAPRPPRREGGFERREGSYEKREGGYQKREGRPAGRQAPRGRTPRS